MAKKEIERVPVEYDGEIDLSKPNNYSTLFDDIPPECFGVLWDPSEKTCRACKISSICAGSFHQKLIAETPKELYLDLVNFDNVPVKAILKKIKSSPKKYTLKSIAKFVGKHSGCSDVETCEYWISHRINDANLQTYLK